MHFSPPPFEHSHFFNHPPPHFGPCEPPRPPPPHFYSSQAYPSWSYQDQDRWTPPCFSFGHGYGMPLQVGYHNVHPHPPPPPPPFQHGPFSAPPLDSLDFHGQFGPMRNPSPPPPLHSPHHAPADSMSQRPCSAPPDAEGAYLNPVERATRTFYQLLLNPHKGPRSSIPPTDQWIREACGLRLRKGRRGQGLHQRESHELSRAHTDTHEGTHCPVSHKKYSHPSMHEGTRFGSKYKYGRWAHDLHHHDGPPSERVIYPPPPPFRHGHHDGMVRGPPHHHHDGPMTARGMHPLPPPFRHGYHDRCPHHVKWDKHCPPPSSPLHRHESNEGETEPPAPAPPTSEPETHGHHSHGRFPFCALFGCSDGCLPLNTDSNANEDENIVIIDGWDSYLPGHPPYSWSLQGGYMHHHANGRGGHGRGRGGFRPGCRGFRGRAYGDHWQWHASMPHPAPDSELGSDSNANSDVEDNENANAESGPVNVMTNTNTNTNTEEHAEDAGVGIVAHGDANKEPAPKKDDEWEGLDAETDVTDQGY